MAPEEIFKRNAKKNMVKYNHEAFKRDYPKLYKAILESIVQAAQKNTK